MNYLDKQIKHARDNYNYFFIKLIFCILKNMIKLSIMFLLSSIFNYTCINIIVLLYTIYTIYNIYSLCVYYFNIINDIKDTLGYEELTFEIDFSLIDVKFLKGMVKYGK